MMDHISHAIIIPFIGNYPDMLLKDHNVSALPLTDIIDICGQRDSGMFKVNLQILHSPEINIGIRFLCCNPPILFHKAYTAQHHRRQHGQLTDLEEISCQITGNSAKLLPAHPIIIEKYDPCRQNCRDP